MSKVRADVVHVSFPCSVGFCAGPVALMPGAIYRSPRALPSGPTFRAGRLHACIRRRIDHSEWLWGRLPCHRRCLSPSCHPQGDMEWASASSLPPMVEDAPPLRLGVPVRPGIAMVLAIQSLLWLREAASAWAARCSPSKGPRLHAQPCVCGRSVGCQVSIEARAVRG